ncbi:MAG: electron transfer flavoprotein subunit beta/FixA family protein [Acidobacteria bacterium]|nr:electron transfer flavoprotein subunit beta/FixA family protein [Acidobacteriota bacterium]
MNTVVLLKMVPDVVEELEVAADGRSLDTEFLRLILNERDNHALELALLLKERHGGKVAAVALDAPEVDEALFTALAKGADRAVKITGVEPGLSTRAATACLAKVLGRAGLWPADLVLMGVQAIDDLDGLMAPLLAQQLGLPYAGIVTRVELDSAGTAATIVKEFPRGVRGEFEITLPAVLGIQAAEKPPRYVPVAKVRAAMKTQRIDSVAGPAMEPGPALVKILRLEKPQATTHAEMLEGRAEAVAGKVCEILAGQGLL